jgi:hypothetical protein
MCKLVRGSQAGFDIIYVNYILLNLVTKQKQRSNETNWNVQDQFYASTKWSHAWIIVFKFANFRDKVKIKVKLSLCFN